MEVILADYLGFCYGVKRAVTIAQENASADGTASTLGPIIHNPQVVERLKSEGVGTVNKLEEMEKGTVIIRSHGVGPDVYEEAEKRGLELVDATCPHVKKAQLSAKKLADKGYRVVIVGEKKHPEVRSIFEWSYGKAADGDGKIDKETITTNFAAYAPYDNPKVTFTIISPDVAVDRLDYITMTKVNKRITTKVSQKYFEIYD